MFKPETTFTPDEIAGIARAVEDGLNTATTTKNVKISRDEDTGRVHVRLVASWGGTLDFWVNPDGSHEHHAHL